MSDVLVINPTEPSTRAWQTPSAEPAAIPQHAVREQLGRILSSRAFARSPRISRFLEFVVEQTLAGQEDKLKEYLLGVEVFNRMDSFDPRIDSIVRVEARRLRYKLDKYYELEGRDDVVYIQFRKGCYVPTFANKKGSEQSGHGLEFPYLKTIDDFQAFAYFAKGRHHIGRWTPDGVAESISCFNQALLEDPECADARSGVAAAWLAAGLMGSVPAQDAMAKARTNATEAVNRRGENAEAHVLLAVVSALHDFEWNEAEDRMRVAIPMDPCRPELRVWYGLAAMLAGRLEEATRELRNAQQSSPTSITAHLAAGFALHLGRSYDDALLQYRLAHDLAPQHYGPHLAMGLLFTDQQMFEQAQHEFSLATQLSPNNPNVISSSIYGHVSAGRLDAARLVAQELSDLAGRQYVPAISLCMAHSALGETDMAIKRLEEAYQERSPWLALVRALPVFATVRNDARYPALTARIGLA